MFRPLGFIDPKHFLMIWPSNLLKPSDSNKTVDIKFIAREVAILVASQRHYYNGDLLFNAK
jgi:hypothetical protein